MVTATAHALADKRQVALQVDQTQAGSRPHNDIAITPLERRARDDAALARSQPLIDPARDGCEPRCAIVVIERNAAAHLLYVGLRVEAVGVAERPVEMRGKTFADRALARS